MQKLEPKQVLNRGYGKIKPDTETIQGFRANLSRLLERCDSQKSEEFHKNLLTDFLRQTYYGDRYFINTKESSDLVIHNDKGADSSVGVIFETKKPTKTSSAEMPRVNHLNTKAVQQLVLYFLRERVTHGNIGVKHLVVTNIYEWFIFDAKLFEALFYGDRELVKQFRDFEEGRLSGTKTDFFYKQIAEPAIAKVIDHVQFTYFDLRNLEQLDLIDLYKIFSPEHLLKLPFVNDSNRLNKPFYNELLYIIGLTEDKDKGKKLIGRRAEGDRQKGSLIENTMSRLQSLGKIARLKNPERFGETEEKRLFNVALQLSINWINRILFLKLLEAQLIKYHQGNQDFAFLDLTKVRNYNDMDSLFFDVLACESNQRDKDIKDIFAQVPYLNSSLFEVTEIEHETIVLSNLKARSLSIFGATVLKDEQGNRRTGQLDTLAYLLAFLNAYKFDRDELENPQEDSEKLINASVLGLIFEKINGYKDGSFYTPGFITMYMCRETIRRAVVQKFNEVKGWNCEDLNDVYERIEDKKEANRIINSLKICDPAVGSGHFLVSALNEMIAIKSELRVLLDRSGRSLKDYRVEVKNDKLLVYDDEGSLFAYHPHNAEKQRVQEALFHEKQTIIEGCLFGVDINPNSVMICRLRLWIELLKNAYYRADGNLETLPNIDINIKEGNSLISQFPIDLNLDLKNSLLSSPKNQSYIGIYKNAVRKYFEAKTKEDKKLADQEIKEMQRKINKSLEQNIPQKHILERLQKELYELENLQLSASLGLRIEVSDPKIKKIHKERETKIAKLRNDIDKINAEIKDFESGKVYSNALEWRFSFPEVLNDDGDFVGFDVIIGNPPYIRQEEIKELKVFLQKKYQCYTGVADLFVYFYELGLNLLKPQGHLTYISSNKYFRAGYGEKLRQFLTDSATIHNLIDFGDYPVFEEAIAYPSIITLSKAKSENNQLRVLSWDEAKKQNIEQFATVLEQDGLVIAQENFKPDGWRLESSQNFDLLTKLRNAGKPLGEYVEGRFYRGILTGFNEAFVIDRATRDRLINEHPSSAEVIKPFLRGRDVKKWNVNFADQYLIKIESSDNKNHTWSNKSGIEAEKIFNETYPAIYRYFLQFKDQLTKRCDQGRFFWELRSCIYWQEFEQPKIVYPDIAQKAEFSYDLDNLYLGNTLYLLPTKELWILGILNGRLVFWFYNQISPQIRGGFLRFIAQYVSQIPIVNINQSQRKAIEKLVKKCLDTKKSDPNADTSPLEKEIDHLVYKLYQLTYEEVKIIDPEFSLTKQEYAAIKIE